MAARHVAPTRQAAIWAGLLAATAAATVGGLLLIHHDPRPVGAFAWFTARPAPRSWQQLRLPDGTGTLAAPPSLARLSADPGTTAAGLPAGSGNLVYLDATPRQGTETLPGWANFRIAHLRNDDAATATLDAHAEHLKFLGGTGSCVLDDYTTRAGARHFREIACLVQDSNSASVIVAATPATDWSRYRAILEQAVAAYSVR